MKDNHDRQDRVSLPNPVPNILRRILQQQQLETERRSAAKSIQKLRDQVADLPPCRPFAEALRAKTPAIIAESKKASPSQGLLRANYDPAAIANAYTSAGAACLSVLTNAAFEGEDQHLRLARSATHLPLLRKDFIMSEYQVYETRLLGADALLLIVACLSPEMLARLHRLGRTLGLAVLVEVHSPDELDIALRIDDVEIIGANNRNLNNFEVNRDTGKQLLQELLDRKPSVLRIAESGIHTAADAHSMTEAGAEALLIGESFMRAEDPGAALKTLATAVADTDELSAVTE